MPKPWMKRNLNNQGDDSMANTRRLNWIAGAIGFFKVPKARALVWLKECDLTNDEALAFYAAAREGRFTLG